MKILEYELIVLVKNTHPNKLEQVLNSYKISYKGAKDELLKAAVAALQSKCLPLDMQQALIRKFKRSYDYEFYDD